jgi:hypothetical protein
MSFENGHLKVGGRTKGVPNRISKEIKDLIGAFLYAEMVSLPDSFRLIKSPEKKLDILIKLLPFIVPKPQDLGLENLPDRKLSAILEILTDESERKVGNN